MQLLFFCIFPDFWLLFLFLTCAKYGLFYLALVCLLETTYIVKIQPDM